MTMSVNQATGDLFYSTGKYRAVKSLESDIHYTMRCATSYILRQSAKHLKHLGWLIHL